MYLFGSARPHVAVEAASPRTARRNKRVAPRPPATDNAPRPIAAEKPVNRQTSLPPVDTTKPPIIGDKPPVSPARPSAQPPDRPAGPPPAPPKPQSPTAAKFDAQTGSCALVTTPPTSPALRHHSNHRPPLHDKPATAAVAASHDVTKHATTAVDDDVTTHVDGSDANVFADDIVHASLATNSKSHSSSKPAGADVTGPVGADVSRPAKADVSYIDAASAASSNRNYELKSIESKEAGKSNSLPRNLHKPPRPPRPMISREDSVTHKTGANSSSESAKPVSEVKAAASAQKEKKMSQSEATHL